MKSCYVLALVENLILILMLTNYAIKSNKKLRALARVTPFMALEKKKKTVMNSFFNAQVNYCPLIWMLDSHKNNTKIKLPFER